MSDIISEGFDKSLAMLEKAKNDIDVLPDAVATFLLIHSAQGVIDNGGYRYFFESNWPSSPPYSRFIEAYRKIGCIKQGEELDRVVSTFPFDNPHLNEESRNKYIEDNLDEDEYEVIGWGDELCGDEDVWAQLEKFYTSHAADFQ
jgi:hypothetical protein